MTFTFACDPCVSWCVSQELRIPAHISILHVEQEVVGDDTVALDSVLQCDTRRYNLMQEEKQINEKLNSGRSVNV